MTESPPEPDRRPRPQFGEYATPEEQRARLQEAAPAVAVTAGSAIPNPAPAPAAAAQTRAHTVDRVVAVSLLAYGLLNVLSSFPAFLDYAAYAETMLAMLGVDAELSDPAAGRPWGVAAALVLAVGWLATAALSIWSMRRGRLTWWIPLVGGVVFTSIAGALMAVPLMNDPAMWQAMLDSVGGTGPG